jgi:hypothetical protein
MTMWAAEVAHVEIGAKFRMAAWVLANSPFHSRVSAGFLHL